MQWIQSPVWMTETRSHGLFPHEGFCFTLHSATSVNGLTTTLKTSFTVISSPLWNTSGCCETISSEVLPATVGLALTSEVWPASVNFCVGTYEVTVEQRATLLGLWMMRNPMWFGFTCADPLHPSETLLDSSSRKPPKTDSTRRYGIIQQICSYEWEPQT